MMPRGDTLVDGQVSWLKCVSLIGAGGLRRPVPGGVWAVLAVYHEGMQRGVV
jgi:hypothetical protein